MTKKPIKDKKEYAKKMNDLANDLMEIINSFFINHEEAPLLMKAEVRRVLVLKLALNVVEFEHYFFGDPKDMCLLNLFNPIYRLIHPNDDCTDCNENPSPNSHLH